MTKQEEIKFINDLIKKNPDATIKDLKRALKDIERAKLYAEIKQVVTIVTINSRRPIKKAI